MTRAFSRGRNGNGVGNVKKMRERANKMEESAAEGRKGLVRGSRRSMRTSKFQMIARLVGESACARAHAPP